MNCKPGDRAFMIHALGSQRGTGANIGRICKVIQPYGMVDTSIGRLLHWVVEMDSLGQTSEFKSEAVGVFPDKYLRPLPPLSEPEETIHREETV